MISVIIPVYNVANYLPQCLDSILAQTYSDFEVILVDDGSPDSSGVICDEYSKKDARIRVVHQQNAGVSAARNRGISEAKGEWISFVDSDDFVEPDYLTNFELDKDDADIIVQGLEYYDQRNNQYFKKVCVENVSLHLEDEDFKTHVAINKILHSGYPVAKAYKKGLIGKDITFDTRISFHEDHILVLSVLDKVRRIRLVDSVAYKYRYYHSDNSLSLKQHSWQNLNDCSNEMIRLLIAIKERYLLRNSKYEKEIFTFAYSPKIDAVYGIYSQKNDICQRRKEMRMVINKRELFKLYRPLKAKSRLIKIIILFSPFVLSDFFFKSLVKYQQRKQ